MERKALGLLLVLLPVALILVERVGDSRASTTTPNINRLFYLSSPSSLTTVRPAPGNPNPTNLTGKPVEFDLPSLLLAQTTVTGHLNFSLWIASNITTTLYVNATLSVKSLSGSWGNGTAPFRFQTSVGRSPTAYSFVGNVDRSLVLGDHIFVSLKGRAVPKANVTLLWGSSSYPSLVVLPLSGYVTLASGQSVNILDRSLNPTIEFDLNSSVPVIIFQAYFISALGKQDISRVNLTLVDPSLRPVRTGTNLEMRQFPISDNPPYVYTTTWVYPSNASDGIYQINVDAYDVQNSLAFSFRGPTTFRLSRASIFSRAPFNYLPYFGVGGALLVVGGVYYRRRKTKKSYLVPFDHFDTLTGGELDGGTVVAVEGNTGAGKTLLSQQLMFEDLKKGRPCVFVATGDFPANIRANMRAMGLDISGYEQSGLVTFVDGYSAEAGQQSREKFAIPSLGDLTTIGIKISSSLPPESFKGGSLYLDSLTPLASKTKPESIVSFVQSLGARVKGMGGKAFFTVGPSVDGKVQRQLEEMADCVVQMEAFEESGARKSRLRISKYRARRHQQGWVIYTIEEGKGIIFYSNRPRR